MSEFLSGSRTVHTITLVLLVVLISLSACATQPSPSTSDLPGFWSGLIHGFTVLFSLIGSLFTDYRIYAAPNSGGWYDLGYFLGASMFLSGGGAGASRRAA